MKLKWGRKVGDLEEYYELENETAGEVLVVYQAVVDYETKLEDKDETPNLNNAPGTGSDLKPQPQS